MRIADVIRLLTCPVCGSDDLDARPVPRAWIGEEVFGPYRGQLGLTGCRRCTFEFVNPRPTETLLGRFYGGSTYDCHDPATTDTIDARARHILGFLGDLVPGQRILDFGCGAGVFLRCAKAAGWDATGYDLGDAAIASCRRQDLRVTDQLDELPRAGFDAIVLNHVFEHVPDHGATLATLRELLAPGGRLFLECPNVRSLRARLSHPWLSRAARFDERYRAFPIHLSYFTPRTLADLLARHGFEVERSDTWGYGVDELRREPDRPHGTVPAHRAGEQAAAADARDRDRPQARRPSPRDAWRVAKPYVKRVMRRLVLDTGLGENVVVLARPLDDARSRTAPRPAAGGRSALTRRAALAPVP